MDIRQKYCISSNELTRRLYNIDMEGVEHEEIEEIIENFTRQLKNSGWTRSESREIVVSGFQGWRRRIRRREAEGQELYRSAARSLPARTRRKLTGREDWYKGDKNRKPDELDRTENRAKKRKRENKLGLSCAKLRISLGLPGFGLFYFDLLTWFGFANIMLVL